MTLICEPYVNILKMYLQKNKFLSQGFQKVENIQDRQTGVTKHVTTATFADGKYVIGMLLSWSLRRNFYHLWLIVWLSVVIFIIKYEADMFVAGYSSV